MNPKIRFRMEISSNGDSQDQIINLISRHNDGSCEITLSELQTFLKLRSYLYPHASNSLLVINSDGQEATVFERDKPFLRIIREEIYELENN